MKRSPAISSSCKSHFILFSQGDHSDSYFNKTGEGIFKQQLYQCMLSQADDLRAGLGMEAGEQSQALILKADIETRPGSETPSPLAFFFFL